VTDPGSLAFGLPPTTLLAAAMLVLAAFNTALMAWLWRFPMLPDPDSRNPHGRSSAPRWATRLHRVVGWLFILCFALLLMEMLPRLWRFREWSLVSLFHAAGGLAIGGLLLAKLAVIRRWPQWSDSLPWLGGGLAALTLLVALSGLLPAALLTRQEARSADAVAGRVLIAARCLQCHGASVIVAERERPERWHRELREMQRRSQRTVWALAISDREREQIAAYLIESRGKR